MSKFLAINDSLFLSIYAEAVICTRFYGVEQVEPIPPQKADQEEPLDGGLEKGVFLLFEEGGHRPLLIGGSGRGQNLGEALRQSREKIPDLQKKWDKVLAVFIPVIWRDDFAPVLEQHLTFTLKPYLSGR